MKSKVIIFCVLLCCSKFAVSVPFPQESNQQRAYQPTNWQGNQNSGEYYHHGNGFAQAQSLDSMISSDHQHEHSHEYLNPGRQNFDNYGFNNNPVLQQSVPIKEAQTFSQESNERKQDTYPVRGNSFAMRTNNQPLRGENQQFRQNNWQAPNQFVNAAASATATAVASAERPLTSIRETYRGPSQHTHYVAPANNIAANYQYNQADRTNTAVRDTHYHPEAERPVNNDRYVQPSGENAESNDEHVHYGTHGTAINSNAPKPASNSYQVEGYNGPPSVVPEAFQNAGNYQIRRGPHNGNLPNAYNVGRPVGTNTGSNGNIRYTRYPPMNSVPINNYGFMQKPGFYKNNNGVPNNYNLPVVPKDYEVSKIVNKKYGDSAMIETPSNEPVPTPNNVIVPSLEENPLLNNGPVSYDATQSPVTEATLIEQKETTEPQTAPDFPSSNPSSPDDFTPQRNIYHHFMPGPDRGFLGNVFKNPKTKELFAKKSNYLVIYQNGTVRHIDDLDQIPSHDQNSIVVRNNLKPTNDNNSKPSPTSSPSENNPASYDGQPDQNNPELSSDKTEYNPPILPPSPKDNNFNQPPVPQYYASKNKYPSSPMPQYANNNQYYLSPIDQSVPNDEHSSTQTPKSPNNEKYNPSPILQPPENNKYNSPTDMSYPNGQTNYPYTFSSPPVKKDKQSPIPPKKGLDNKLLQKFLESLSNDANKKPLLDASPFDSGDKNNNTSEPIIPKENNNYDTTWSNYKPSTPPTKLHTHISPGIIKTTTPSSMDENLDFPHYVVPDKTPTPAPVDSGDKNKTSHLPRVTTSKDNNFTSTTPLSPKDNNEYPSSTQSTPSVSYDDKKYDSTQANDNTTPSPKIQSTTDKVIQQLEDLFSDKFDDDDFNNPSEGEQDTVYKSKRSDNKTTPAPLESSSSSTTSTTTPSPVESEDTIITISPIELLTDNVKYDVPESTKDEIAKTTPSPKEKGEIDDLIISIISDNSNKTAEVINIKDIKTKNSTETVAKDTPSTTERPAKPDDRTKPTKQSDVNTGDNSTTGGSLLESKTNISDVTITLMVPNDSDDTITVKIEVPDTTGFEEASGDDTLIVSINTKNYTAADAVTATRVSSGAKNTNQTSSDDADQSKNLVIDLSNSAIFWNNTNEKDFLDKLISNSSATVVYVFQMKPQPIIERNKVTTIFANDTVIEEISETTWQSKDDSQPTVINTTKIYHRGKH